MLRNKSISELFLIPVCLTVMLVSIYFLIGQHPYYALIPPFFILTMFFFGRFPEIGFYIVVTLIPFYRLRGKTPWVVAGLVIFFLSLQIILKKKPLKKINSNLWPLFILFLLVNLSSAFLSEYKKTSFVSVLLLAISYVYFTLGVLIIDKHVFSKILPKIIVLSVGISTFLGIIGKIFSIPFFLTYGAVYERITGGSGDPNNLSLMIIFSFPLLVHLFLDKEEKSHKVLYGILIIINVVGLVLTYSRGGFLIFLLMLSLLGIFHFKKLKPRHFGAVIMVLLLVIATGITLTPRSFWERQKSIREKGLSISRREAYITIGIDAFKKRPVLGNGPRTFRDLFAKSDYATAFAREKASNQFRRYAHNTYLEVLVGTGLIGIIVYFAILLRALKNLIMSLKVFTCAKNNEMANLVRSYLLSYITLIFYLFIFSSLYQKYLWLSFALSEISMRLASEETCREGE